MAERATAFRQVRGGGGTRFGRPIDLVHLAAQSLGDKSLEEEVLRAFDVAVGVYMDRVRSARDRDGLQERLRLLKAVAGGVGAWPLHDLAAMAEAEVAAGYSMCPEDFDDLAFTVAEVQAFVTDLLGDDGDRAALTIGHDL
ncbi:MAG TPA: hypothetical protein VIL84_14335 [Devosiaceae bacterium]